MVTKNILEDLENIIRGDVMKDEVMARHTSFKIGGPADIYVEPEDARDIADAVKYLRDSSIPFVVLGCGTNVLVRDGGIKGAVISTARIKNIERIDDTKIYADAGASIAGLLRAAERLSLKGLEFLAGIPGSVGGAAVMNAGAWGSDMSEVTDEVTILGADNNIAKINRHELSFEYRKLHMGEGEIILGAVFSLVSGDREEIKRKIKENLGKRSERQPLRFPSAGSVFKNSKEGPAGRIIDELGLKGKRIGGAAISDVHANFIVNIKEARAQDVLDLIGLISERVKKVRKIDLEMEIKVLGVD
jgi:UDP-N-acetylmuramate dehydrogenase